MKEQIKSNVYVVPAVILGLGILLAAFAWGYFYYSARQLDNAVSVTGSARVRVTSDDAKWTIDITRTVRRETMKSGFAALASDLAIVKTFLASKDVKDTEVTVGTVFTEEIYNSNNSAENREYTLRQSITVDSADVAKVTALAASAKDLADRGVFISARAPEYYYTKLADLRLSLLSKASEDAQRRAGEMVRSSGGKVGSLRQASSGVVQVLSPGSNDVSDYGSYDTGTIEKDVMATVRLSFSVK